MPISVAEQSKARVCGRSLAGVTGSSTENQKKKPAVGMDICVVCFIFKKKRQNAEQCRQKWLCGLKRMSEGA